MNSNACLPDGGTVTPRRTRFIIVIVIVLALFAIALFTIGVAAAAVVAVIGSVTTAAGRLTRLVTA